MYTTIYSALLLFLDRVRDPDNYCVPRSSVGSHADIARGQHCTYDLLMGWEYGSNFY